MEKWKRSARLVDMTRQLLGEPRRLIPLTAFAQRYQAAKSSISEDLDIIDDVLRAEGGGELETLAGAAGGVRYLPGIHASHAMKIVEKLCGKLSDADRLLPGGFLYVSDLLGDPVLLSEIGRIFASVFARKTVDAVMTVETKGIPLAYATAFYLRVPVVIARYGYRVTEGSVVTVNTVSGSGGTMRQLSLSKRSLAQGSRVLIIDDFMKGGGTVRGMMDLLSEFQAEVAGIGVMLESRTEQRLVDSWVSLAQVKEVDMNKRRIEVVPGNVFDPEGGLIPC
ncbi:pur operon repressor [Staphylospora marina]|uniref:pur operon repressor n=1 Tax=Staphylospora marina TaxID=2490858 RepID=UPI000F5BD00D|nr:pur operon repressor [Staphylospora marina]